MDLVTNPYPFTLQPVPLPQIEKAFPLHVLRKSPHIQECWGVARSDEPKPFHLHWVKEAGESFKHHVIGVWIVDQRLQNSEAFLHWLEDSTVEKAVYLTEHVTLSLAHILPLFDPRQSLSEDAVDFIPGTFIHRSAEIDENVIIKPGAYIGPGCRIGRGSRISSHVVLEAFTEIGENCLIHAGTVVGADGFGFFPNPDKHLKIPQVGWVKIESEVEIGALVSIDRATIADTRIGSGSKLDNQIHIGHNARIGPNALIAAGFMCGGSVKIGRNFTCGGGVLVSDHVTICDHVTIGGNSGVTKDIQKPGVYVGYPLQPYREGLKTIQNLTRLEEMRKDWLRLRRLR